MSDRFENFSQLHLQYSIIFTAVIIILLIIPWILKDKNRRNFEIFIATFFLSCRFLGNAITEYLEHDPLIMFLPLQLCSIISIIDAVSLYFIDSKFVKKYSTTIAYAGIMPSLVALTNIDTVNNILANSNYFFAHFMIFYFFLYFMLIKGYRIPENALGLTISSVLCYAMIIFCFNFITGANFLYLRTLPKSDTIASVMGAFPFFDFTFVGLGLVAFTIMHCLYFGIRFVFNVLKEIQYQIQWRAIRNKDKKMHEKDIR